MNFSTWSINDYATLWGVVIATFALAWNTIRELRSGPRIYVQVAPNMMLLPGNSDTRDKKYIFVTAVNRGNAATTITHFCGFYSKNLWNIIRKKHRKYFMISHPMHGSPMPCRLDPGEEWKNMVDQSEIQKTFGDKYLYIGVIHNQRNAAIYKRVRVNS